MNKGKKPIDEEEEEFLSLDEDDNYDPSVILSPIRLASPEFSIISSGGSGSSKETSQMDEMVAAKEDFFRKFLNMNFADESSPIMNKQYSILPTSKAANFPIAEPRNQPPGWPVSPKIYPMPLLPPLPRLAPDADTDADTDDKPFLFRKIMPPDELAEVAINDPKRARKIVTNRLSAIRAKEKKKMYMHMLEHKVQHLQSKSAELSARLTLLRTGSNSLNSEHNFLKDRLQIVTQRLHLQDILNDQIRSEIQHMRNVLAQITPSSGSLTGYSGNNNHAVKAFLAMAAQQLEQLQQGQVGNFQLHSYSGLCNFGSEYERGECSQHQQQLRQQQNPQPYDQYQVQNNKEEQPSKFEQMRAEDYSEDSHPSPNEEEKK